MTTSRWSFVAAQLRAEIAAGQTGANGELDTEAELCRRFATSRITIRRALSELRTEGLITSRRGSGTKAVRRPDSARSTVIMQGQASSERAILVRSNIGWRTMRAPTELIASLSRTGGEHSSAGRWLRLSYDVRANGSFFDAVTVWFSPCAVPYVDRVALGTGYTAALIQEAGLPLGRSIQSVTARWDPRRMAPGVDPNMCIDLMVERVMFTANDDVAFVSIHRHPAMSTVVRVDLPTTNQRDVDQIGVSQT
jgi:GntR family transcriptional regulator